MSPQNDALDPGMQAPDSGVAVRMYNPGFGDCFLLAFRAQDNTPFFMLIDCGVHHQYPGREHRLGLIAEDIVKATGRHLHVVAATHEHTDHLYGFKYGREGFDKIDIDDLWLAWTEDPDDPVAQELKRLYGMRMRALAAAIGRLRLGRDRLADSLEKVYNFEFPDALAATGGKAAQLEYLRAKSKRKPEKGEDYLRPGKGPLTLPGVVGVKVYVLGPPEEVRWIRSMTRESQMYPELAALDEISAFSIAALAAAGEDSLTEEDQQLFRRSRPFDPSLEIGHEDARSDPQHGQFFRRAYGFTGRRGHGPKWRRIDTDWLSAAGELALDINGKTNNTSLVLAFELTDSEPHKILLFAADAQVGNWLSWHELSWSVEGEAGKELTTEDLLRRTVLYKVGHHGSRNATLSWKGLEMMESGDLVAMLSVDQEWANDAMDWEHPAEKLIDRLKAQTKGRILRTDRIPPDMPQGANSDTWESFVKNVTWDQSPEKLWIQYTVPA